MCTLDGKKRVKKEKKEKNVGTFRQQGSDTSATVCLLMWCLLLLGKWRFDVSVRRKGLREDEMTAFVCPSYHPTAHVSDLSLSCKEKMLCAVRELEGWRVRRGEGGGDDRVTG